MLASVTACSAPLLRSTTPRYSAVTGLRNLGVLASLDGDVELGQQRHRLGQREACLLDRVGRRADPIVAGAAEVCAAQVGVEELGPCKIGARAVNAVEVGLAEICLTGSATQEAGLAEVKAEEVAEVQHA